LETFTNNHKKTHIAIFTRELTMIPTIEGLKF